MTGTFHLILLEMMYADELIVCRTNGALEHFNRELNHSFPNAHPSMTEFVTVIRRIKQENAAQYDRVAKRRERSPVHQPVNLLMITIPLSTMLECLLNFLIRHFTYMLTFRFYFYNRYLFVDQFLCNMLLHINNV